MNQDQCITYSVTGRDLGRRNAVVGDDDDAEGLLVFRNDPLLLSGLPGLPYQPSDDEAPGGDDIGDK